MTAVSRFVAALGEKAYDIKPTVILNGVCSKKIFSTFDLQPSYASQYIKGKEIAAEKEPLDSLERAKSVQMLMVGRLSIQKNPIFAIQALALLRGLPWNLKIVGEGPLFPSLAEIVKSKGLEEKISFLGWLRSNEVTAIMKQSDILLLPSLSEGLPMVGIEALFHGLAIVGSRIGGLQDIIVENENGSFFNLNEGPLGMAKALRPLLEQRVLLKKMQQASLQKAKEFEWEKSMDAYEKIFQLVGS